MISIRRIDPQVLLLILEDGMGPCSECAARAVAGVDAAFTGSASHVSVCQQAFNVSTSFVLRLNCGGEPTFLDDLLPGLPLLEIGIQKRHLALKQLCYAHHAGDT